MRRSLRLLKGGGAEEKSYYMFILKENCPVKEILELNGKVKMLYKIAY